VSFSIPSFCAESLFASVSPNHFSDLTFSVYRAPDWFQAEERRCNRFTMPLTKEEIGAAKSQFNSINARTIKKVRSLRFFTPLLRSHFLKVAEATARKKMRAKKAMEKAKAKANSIAESDEMGVKAKQRSIEKLCVAATYKQASLSAVVTFGAGTSRLKAR